MRYASGCVNEGRQTRYYGAVEAGGSKFVCAVGDASGRIHIEERFATIDPPATLASVVDFLRRGSRTVGPLLGIGVGCFGPLELGRHRAGFGRIGRTPKAGWSGADILGSLAEFACPLSIDTDVNAAALAEHRWGAAQDVQSLVYLTIGTGIGGGVVINGAPVHGLMHPEIGHLFPRRHPEDRDFAGVCPFHADCYEGLASGPAIIARRGAALTDLDPGDVQWEIEADYLGQLCAAVVLTLAPERIVIGGGVMQQTRLLRPLRARLRHLLHDYIDRPQLDGEIDRFVVPPGLGSRSGVLGALALALGCQ
jgi:fructokinase